MCICVETKVEGLAGSDGFLCVLLPTKIAHYFNRTNTIPI